MAAPALTREQPRVVIGSRFLPSLADFFGVALLIWLFGPGEGWGRLLMDADTGWHIRTGEYILATGQVPYQDLFSFSKPGAEWFAWEWLTDVIYALLHAQWGLSGVVAFSGILICLTALLLLQRMVTAGANAIVALTLTLLFVGAGSLHFHARPHIVTFVFLLVSSWLVSADMDRPRRRIWLLVPVAVVWANMHGGFLAMIAVLGLTAVGLAAERRFSMARRYLLLTGVCLGASVVNPYGWNLHIHVANYLRSSFIATRVGEFQPPSFTTESALQYELLLFLGLAACVLALRRGRIAPVLPVLYFAHASLGAVRHAPLYVILCAPLIASEATTLWAEVVARSSSKSVAGILDQLSCDMRAGLSRCTGWGAVFVAAALAVWPASAWPEDFGATFPRAMLAKHSRLFTEKRVFTKDQWADYLIYHLHPKFKGFIDGRSDFFGETIGREYIAAMELEANWASVLDRYGFNLILIPAKWPLVSVLRLSPSWQVVDSDATAVLFTRSDLSKTRKPGLMNGTIAAESTKREQNKQNHPE